MGNVCIRKSSFIESQLGIHIQSREPEPEQKTENITKVTKCRDSMLMDLPEYILDHIF